MKNKYLAIALLAAAPLLSQCTSASRRSGEAARQAVQPQEKKAAQPAAGDDLDEYAVVEIADPLEKLNRRTFWLNDKMYLVVRPLSKGYEKAVPKRARNGIYNAFENVKFPIRFVNSLLQGKVKGAGLQLEKFAIDTVAGLGGMIRVSPKIQHLADLPDEDTGKTFAKWGMGHGPYLVIPFLGPSSLRDGIGLIGDYAMNPVNWGVYWGGDHDWTMILPSANTLRALPVQLGLYDDAKADAVDAYIAIRSAYVQNRAASVGK